MDEDVRHRLDALLDALRGVPADLAVVKVKVESVEKQTDSIMQKLDGGNGIIGRIRVVEDRVTRHEKVLLYLLIPGLVGALVAALWGILSKRM